MGCLLAKLECCVISERCHCIHPRLGCFVIAVISILSWIGITMYFLFDEGVGFFNTKAPIHWLSRCYVCCVLAEAAVRVVSCVVLIIACARKLVQPLKCFLVVWILLFGVMLGNLILALVISYRDVTAIIFNLVYAVGRTAYGLFALVIVNSYRVELEEEIQAKIEARRREVNSMEVEVM